MEVEKGSVGTEIVSESENTHDFPKVFIGDNWEIDDIVLSELLWEGEERRGKESIFSWTDASNIFNDIECSNCLLHSFVLSK
jgi:hypothetical protein